MSFLHFVSRSLLAGYFIADGLKAVVDPEPLVPGAEPLASKVGEYADRYLPPDLVRFVPTTTQTLVRFHGITQAAGALMMVTGIFRRAGAAIVVAAYVPKVIIARRDCPDRLSFLRELALLGGALVEAGNTQGKPNRAWLAADRKKRALSSLTVS